MEYDPAPIIPGLRDNKRYEWLPDGDTDVAAIQDGIQEGGQGLYLVWCPHRKRKVLIEAYHPWELRHEGFRAPKAIVIQFRSREMETGIMSNELNPYQYSDFKYGRLICIHEQGVLEGARGFVAPESHNPFPGGVDIPTSIDNRTLVPFRRGNHAARGYFERKKYETPEQHKINLMKRHDREEAEYDAWAGDWSSDWGKEMEKLLTPKIAT